VDLNFRYSKALINKCENCGMLITGYKKRCPTCGKDFELKEVIKKCKTCGMTIPQSTKKCPICGTRYEIPFNENNPKFDSISRKISPRVDSSHILVQYLLPIKIRVSGPGEISYFAQVFPAATAIGIKMPILLKYTRMFYNTPWLETLGKVLSERDLPTLHSKDFFMTLSGWVKAKRKNEPKLLLHETEKLTNLINSVHNKLYVVKDKDVERYLSWQFGVFGTGTFGQEVSWNWIDLAVNTGIEDYLQTYMRYYENETPISGYYFLNTLTT